MDSASLVKYWNDISDRDYESMIKIMKWSNLHGLYL